MSMKSNPVIVFTSSETPNWGEDKCKDKKEYKISEDDKHLLSLYTKEKSVNLLVQVNSLETSQLFSVIATIFPNYKMSGMINIGDQQFDFSFFCNLFDYYQYDYENYSATIHF